MSSWLYAKYSLPDLLSVINDNLATIFAGDLLCKLIVVDVVRRAIAPFAEHTQTPRRNQFVGSGRSRSTEMAPFARSDINLVISPRNTLRRARRCDYVRHLASSSESNEINFFFDEDDDATTKKRRIRTEPFPSHNAPRT